MTPRKIQYWVIPPEANGEFLNDFRVFQRQLAHFGDSWHSFEWKVPDLAAAKEVLDSKGIRLGTYVEGAFLMTHPRDTHGMIIEMCPFDMRGDLRLESDWSHKPRNGGVPPKMGHDAGSLSRDVRAVAASARPREYELSRLPFVQPCC